MIMKLKNFPSVTFVTPTLNSESIIQECIESVRTLNYPKNKIKMFIMDDGSTDATKLIVSKYSFCTFIPVKTSGPEEATAIGFKRATTDYVVNLSSDNILPHQNWLQELLEPLETDRTIAASESILYTYNKSDKLLNRYFALFGMNDPVAYYLGKRDRRTYFESQWHLQAPSQDRGTYYVADFTERTLPTLGANGFVMRSTLAHLVSRNPKRFSHIDSCVDLIRSGHAKFAFVKTSLWHKSGETFTNYFYKRRRYALELYFKKQQMRRYHLYNPSYDRIRLGLYIIFSLTLIEPTFQSLRGFLVVRDGAWFLHPIICFLTTLNYIYTVLFFTLSRFGRRA